MTDPWRSTIETALNRTEQAFRDNPANFSDERAVAEDIRARLVDAIGTVDVSEVEIEDGTARGSVPDHKEYTARYRDVTEIDCAHCEIGGQKFPFPHRERMDLGLFDDGVTLTLDGGTQQFDPSDLLAGLEFKYVKNINYLRHRPENSGSKYKDIADDIERLGDLPSDVERWCLVFGNYGLLRHDDGQIANSLHELATENDVTLRFVLPKLD
ncbi:hypothetical protein [Haloarcula amylovorans]|uniref:hypothetical protein n=1 Tax=Haloarcula amylovorans TaxID=2562280 RepID=UPI001FD841D1|nr:hypothetical protein [Halomicroarcula amylolytica]